MLKWPSCETDALLKQPYTGLTQPGSPAYSQTKIRDVVDFEMRVCVRCPGVADGKGDLRDEPHDREQTQL